MDLKKTDAHFPNPQKKISPPNKNSSAARGWGGQKLWNAALISVSGTHVKQRILQFYSRRPSGWNSRNPLTLDQWNCPLNNNPKMVKGSQKEVKKTFIPDFMTHNSISACTIPYRGSTDYWEWLLFITLCLHKHIFTINPLFL